MRYKFTKNREGMEKKKPDYGMKCIHFSIYFNEKNRDCFCQICYISTLKIESDKT